MPNHSLSEPEGKRYNWESKVSHTWEPLGVYISLLLSSMAMTNVLLLKECLDMPITQVSE